MQKYSLEIIGTHLSLSVDTDRDMEGVFHDIEKRLRDFEAKYSRFLEGNWLHDLNRNRRAFLDTDGRTMLSFSLDIARATWGYFDPTVGKRLTELGYGDARLQILDSRKTQGMGDYRDIQIVGDEVILHGDIFLEFGGVGKGYLIDRIREMIDMSFRHAEERSIQVPGALDSSFRQNDGSNVKRRYLINFGGDLYGKGGWKVGLESPFASDEVIGTILLDDDFLACSAGTRRKWGSHHHLIDPHTGESAREVIASYVEGTSGIVTDAYATTLCVMPWDLAVETLEKTSTISGVIVRHDGVLYQKEGSRAEVFS